LGAASFNAGKYELAVRQLTTAINSEGLSPENTAKALYFRGLAQQRLGQSGRAISDLGAAIFLGLSQEERVSALVNRGLAYRAAGLSGQAEAEIAQARKLGGSGAVEELVARSGTSPREAAAMTSFSTEVRSASGRETIASTPAAAPAPLPDATSPSAQPESGNRLTRWWGSMRGNSPEAAPAAPPPPAATAEAKPEVVAQGWSTHTEASQSATARAPAPAAPPPAWSTHTEAAGTAEQGTRYASAAPEAPAPTGNFRLQLSPTRSESEAMALWKQVSSQNQQVAGLNPSIEKTDMGNLGTFYRLQIGPFPSKAESLKVCNALKRGGVDCFLVTN
jgi:tetratricopeptide (TPR) repeat protein